MDSYSDIVQTLLRKRGITTHEEADAFLNPSYDLHVHDPFLMKDMNIAVARILSAMRTGEKIAIYSDFDADGIPAGVLVHDFFKKVGYENFVNYIPHRDSEGYGFHRAAVDKLVQDDVSLIITVDVGITDVDTVSYACERGIDVVITDHHEPLEKVPDAFAILNPKQEDCDYPFDGLCGTGVAFKLVQALLIKGTFADVPEGWEKWLLDLVAIATVADMMPLVDENRALVYWGLRVLRKSPRPGIQALCRKLRLVQSKLTEDDIGFSIGPRINAASRMGKPEDAFDLLCTSDVVEAESLAVKLESLNNKRKGAVANIVKQAKKKFEKLAQHDELPPVLVTGDPDWNPALVGLAASSLADHFSRTVCIWGRDGVGTLKGSCRTDGTVSAVELFTASGGALSHFGGHRAAGGFSVKDAHIHTLSEAFNRAYAEVAQGISEQMPVPDAVLTLNLVGERFFRDIAQLAPFGIGNPKPVFAFGVNQIENVRIFGKEQNHIEIMVRDGGGTARKASKFFATQESFTRVVTEGESVQLFARIEESSFGGRRSIELRIVDIV